MRLHPAGSLLAKAVFISLIMKVSIRKSGTPSGRVRQTCGRKNPVVDRLVTEYDAEKHLP